MFESKLIRYEVTARLLNNGQVHLNKGQPYVKSSFKLSLDGLLRAGGFFGHRRVEFHRCKHIFLRQYVARRSLALFLVEALLFVLTVLVLLRTACGGDVYY